MFVSVSFLFCFVVEHILTWLITKVPFSFHILFILNSFAHHCFLLFLFVLAAFSYCISFCIKIKKNTYYTLVKYTHIYVCVWCLYNMPATPYICIPMYIKYKKWKRENIRVLLILNNQPRQKMPREKLTLIYYLELFSQYNMHYII